MVATVGVLSPAVAAVNEHDVSRPDGDMADVDARRLARAGNGRHNIAPGIVCISGLRGRPSPDEHPASRPDCRVARPYTERDCALPSVARRVVSAPEIVAGGPILISTGHHHESSGPDRRMPITWTRRAMRRE